MAYYYPFFNISIWISIFTLATQHALYIHKRIVFIPMSLFCTDTRRVIMTLSKIVFTPRVVLTPMWSQNDSLLESLHSFKEWQSLSEFWQSLQTLSWSQQGITVLLVGVIALFQLIHSKHNSRLIIHTKVCSLIKVCFFNTPWYINTRWCVN